MRRLLAVSLVSLVLAGCVPPPQAPEPPPPAPVITPTPRPTTPPPAPLASDWNDWPFTPGDWAYRRDGSGSIASFGAGPVTDEVTLRCDTAKRTLILTVRAALGTTIIRTTTMSRSLAMSATAGWEAPHKTIQIVPSDPLLDAIAFSRGRFVIERPIAPPFVLRPDPEIGRVIEDCRG